MWKLSVEEGIFLTFFDNLCGLILPPLKLKRILYVECHCAARRKCVNCSDNAHLVEMVCRNRNRSENLVSTGYTVSRFCRNRFTLVRNIWKVHPRIWTDKQFFHLIVKLLCSHWPVKYIIFFVKAIEVKTLKAIDKIKCLLNKLVFYTFYFQWLLSRQNTIESLTFFCCCCYFDTK